MLNDPTISQCGRLFIWGMYEMANRKGGGGNSHQRAQERARQEKVAEQLAPLVAQVVQKNLSTQPKTPWQSTLLWGALSLAVGIVITVIAAMMRDIRWLLYFSLPFLGFSCFEFLSYFPRFQKRRLIATGLFCIVCLVALICLHMFLRPKSEITKAEPPPIEVVLRCDPEQLPIKVPLGETAQIVSLNPVWPISIAQIRSVANTGQASSVQWPDDDLLSRLDSSAPTGLHGSPRSAYRCDFVNHSTQDVVEMTIPFHSHFGVDSKTRWHQISVFVNPLDKGTTKHIYFVSPCPEVALFHAPKTAVAKFAGESTVRKFQLELAQHPVGGEFWPAPFNWSGADCSPEAVVKSDRDENEPRPEETIILLPPGAKQLS